MENIEEEGIRKFNELRLKAAQKISPIESSTFSTEAVSEFARGFDVILGFLSYLKEKTFHQTVQCNITCDQINDHLITDINSYMRFSGDLENITPPIAVNFTFILSNDQIGIGELRDDFAVYFQKKNYEIVFKYQSDGSPNEFRLVKEYMTHIEPDETKTLQNLIWNSFLTQTANKLED